MLNRKQYSRMLTSHLSWGVLLLVLGCVRCADPIGFQKTKDKKKTLLLCMPIYYYTPMAVFVRHNCVHYS